ncbi:MAG: hypothetical protein LUD22_01510 [Coprobacillus sp.]|nr:hypothetical protein [Coprobacillus sp.]
MPRKKRAPFAATDVPLPINRRGQLKDTLRWRFWDYVIVSIYMFIFLIPLVFWLIFSYYTFLSDVDPSIWIYLIVYGVAIPLIVVFGLGIGGGLNFFKKTFYNEGSTVTKDFFEGVRKYAKGCSLSFLTFGIVYFLMNIFGAMLDYNTSMSTVWKVIIIGLMYVIFIIVFMVTALALTQSIFYNATFTQLITNSVRFIIGDFGRVIGVTAIMLVPFFCFSFIPYFIGQAIVVLVCALFYFGFSTAVFMLYSMYIFDRTINSKSYPEVYRKGLAKEIDDSPIQHEK